MDFGESDKMYPVLLMPRKCISFGTNQDATDSVFVFLNITFPDTEGNQSRIYSGLCNVKFVDSFDQCISDVDVNGQADLNETHIPIHHANQSYEPYSQSQVWIDPARSPHVFNNNGMAVGSQENYLKHQQSHSNHITVEQQNTYHYNELIQNSPIEEFEHKKLSKSPATDTNLYQYNEFESGIFLAQLPEEIMPENENRVKEELQQNDLQRENDALEQLMSSDIQPSSKQQKIILYSGHDSHGQTIQKIRVNDPFLECVENEVEKEVIAETTTTNRKKYQCEKCAKLFNQITAFKQHMVRSHRSKMPTTGKGFGPKFKYTCSHCGKVLKSQKKYETHCLGHGNPDLECAKCHNVFATKFTLRNHQKVHQKKFPCVYCKKSYHYGRKLKNHLKKIHLIFICDVCDYSASEYSELQAHESTHKEVEQTDENRDYIRTLEDDLIVDNSNTLAASSADFIIKSDEDQTRLDEIENAESDIAKVLANEVFMSDSTKVLKYKKYKKSCNVCLKSFDRAGDLKRHLIEHVVRSTLDKTPVNQNGNLTIKCEVCQLETFSRVDKFKAHLREHAKLTLYKCTSCDKSFSDSSNFSKHKKIHGPSFFQCDLCQRKFHSKKMIIRHMEYHKNNTPISCSFCDKEFHFSSTLNKHIKSAHTRERAKFRCKFCKEYFNTLKEKWDHEWLVHHVRKMNANCWICKSQFRKYSDLKRHCTLAHDMKMPPAKEFLLANR